MQLSVRGLQGYLADMIRRMLQGLRSRWLAWLRTAPDLWREPSLAPRPSGHGLEIPLLPSGLARRAGRMFLAAQLLYAAELGLSQHWIAAGASATLAAAFWWQVQVLRLARHRARRLLVTADGRLCLLTVSGAMHAVRVDPASIRLGPWLLLRLNGAQLRMVLLLGPDNLEPALLADLWRRLLHCSKRGSAKVTARECVTLPAQMHGE